MAYTKVDREIRTFYNRPPITFAHHAGLANPTEFRFHLNNYIEFYFYVSGDADYIVEDQYFRLEHGDVIVINPYEAHTPVLKQPCEYERFYILVPTDSIQDFVHDPLRKVLDKQPGVSALLPRSPELRQRVLPLLYHISDLCQEKKDPLTELQAFSAIMELICILCGQLPEEKDDARTTVALSPLLKDVLRYVNQELRYIESVAEIARHFDVSEPYLSALFKKQIGVNLNRYLRTRKIALAKRLLEEGATVTRACYESGFNECSYFIKCFREGVGMTPLQYQKQTQKS